MHNTENKVVKVEIVKTLGSEKQNSEHVNWQKSKSRKAFRRKFSTKHLLCLTTLVTVSGGWVKVLCYRLTLLSPTPTYPLTPTPIYSSFSTSVGAAQTLYTQFQAESQRELGYNCAMGSI